VKCPACPAAGRCVVEFTGHVAFCGWAASGNPAAIARVVAMSADAPGSDDVPDAKLPADRPSAVESISLLRLAKACPFSSKDSGCGCSGRRCALRQPGRQIVSLQTCMDCASKYGA
jgi:hypothetical protein